MEENATEVMNTPLAELTEDTVRVLPPDKVAETLRSENLVSTRDQLN